jgi:hypothetical protein
LAEDELPEDDQPPEYLAANLRRCPGCGGMVYQWPCLACRIRDAQEAGLALSDGEPTAHITATSGHITTTSGLAMGCRSSETSREGEAPAELAEHIAATSSRALRDGSTGY